MIHFAQKPGLNAYWVRDSHYTKLAGRIVSENREVIGRERFAPANLAGIWEVPLLKIFKDGDRCDYWEPHEVEFMAEQSRAGAA